MLDIATGNAKTLSPAGRRFTLDPLPASYEQQRLAVVEDGQNHNIWSIDLASGRARQVTNNKRLQSRCGYLPESNRILFQEQWIESVEYTAEICAINDDGSDFSMLTHDNTADWQPSISLHDGGVAYQSQEKVDSPVQHVNESSIMTAGADGGGSVLVARSGEGGLSLSDPVFVWSPEWRDANPLSVTADISNQGQKSLVTVEITNTGAQTVDATLNALPGAGLSVEDAGGPGRLEAAGAQDLQNAAGQPGQMQLQLRLEPGQSRKVEINVVARQGAGSAGGGRTLLLTLAVPGSPPLMIWKDLA